MASNSNHRMIKISGSLIISSSPHFKQAIPSQDIQPPVILLEYPCAPTIERLSHACVAGCNLLHVQGKISEKKVSQPSPEKDGTIPKAIPILYPGFSAHFPCFPSLYPCSMGASICSGHSSHDFHVARIPAPSSPAPLLQPPKTIPLTSSSFGTANRVHLKGKEFGTTSA